MQQKRELGSTLRCSHSIISVYTTKVLDLQEDFGLGYYDTHFRNLDPQIGRWWEIDPKCESNINPGVAGNDEVQDESEVGGFESASPYMSMGDDPILHNDPEAIFWGLIMWWARLLERPLRLEHKWLVTQYPAIKLQISVGVVAAEGFVTDGSSNLAKAAVKVGGAIENSYIDNHGKGIKSNCRRCGSKFGYRQGCRRRF